MLQARKGAAVGEVKQNMRRRESPGSLIAQTTGVSLIPCFVGGDKEMRGRVPLLLLRSRAPAYSLDFSLVLDKANFVSTLQHMVPHFPPTRLSPCAQRLLSLYILL